MLYIVGRLFVWLVLLPLMLTMAPFFLLWHQIVELARRRR